MVSVADGGVSGTRLLLLTLGLELGFPFARDERNSNRGSGRAVYRTRALLLAVSSEANLRSESWVRTRVMISCAGGLRKGTSAVTGHMTSASELRCGFTLLSDFSGGSILIDCCSQSACGSTGLELVCAICERLWLLPLRNGALLVLIDPTERAVLAILVSHSATVPIISLGRVRDGELYWAPCPNPPTSASDGAPKNGNACANCCDKAVCELASEGAVWRLSKALGSGSTVTVLELQSKR